MAQKISINELRKLVKQVISEGPYDDIDFGFLDQEDQEKSALWTKASEEFYNKMAKDSDILKEIYRIFLDMPDESSAKAKFMNSQYYNRVENYMEDLYRNYDRKKFGDGQLLKLCETTFDKFFSAAYEAAKKRHERSQMDNYIDPLDKLNWS